MELSHSRSRPTNRSKLYERYDVEIQTSQENSSRKWLNEQGEPREIPLEERSTLELMLMIYKTLHWKTKLMAFAVLLFMTSMAIRIAKRPKAKVESTVERRWMHPDSHQRNNPFAPEGETTYMEGILEYKRIGGRNKEVQQQSQMQQSQQERNWAQQAVEFSLLPAKEQQNLLRGQGQNPIPHEHEDSGTKQYSNDARHDVDGNRNNDGEK